MVQLYSFNHLRKLRALSRAWKRVYRHLSIAPQCSQESTSSLSPMAIFVEEQVYPCLLDEKRSSVAIVPEERRAAIRDSTYYADEESKGLCVFQAGNVLFRVHRCLLMREASVFRDMLSLPCPVGRTEGMSDEAPVILSDDPEQFKDLLWVVHAPPSQFCLYTTSLPEDVPLGRLLNIAHMANKYCFDFYESWAMERVYLIARSPEGFLKYGLAHICARVLHLAHTCHHHRLLDLVTRHLVSRLLWTHDIQWEPIREAAEQHSLCGLLGVTYYRQLLETLRDNAGSLPLEMGRKGILLYAQDSLERLWEHHKSTLPISKASKVSGHEACLASLEKTWDDAGKSPQIQRIAQADILERLRYMMHHCRKTLPAMNAVCIDCTMETLEAISTTRDNIIDNLISHFYGGRFLC